MKRWRSATPISSPWKRSTPPIPAISERPSRHGPHDAHQGQGGPGLRPRPQGSLRHPGGDEGQGDQRLHAWRSVAGTFLSEAQGLSASRRKLRRRLAGSAEGIRRISWPDRHDLQLSDRAAAALSRPHFHGRSGRLAGRPSHRKRRFLQCGASRRSRCRASPRMRRRRR